jgi:predicted deacetylase
MPNLINISVDDVSPHPLSSIKVLNNFKNIIKEFPEVKITLFVPTAYWRTMRSQVSTKHPLQLDLFPEFCESLKSLSDDNFEICYHGHYHGIPGRSDNDEMRSLDYDGMKILIETMRATAKKAGLENVFKDIIRPPAWRMSPDAIKAAKDEGIDLLALSSKVYPDGSLDYKGEDKKFGKVVYFTACPPFSPLELVENTEIVYHACEWDKNYLSEQMSNDLGKFLRKNIGNYEFSFIDGLANG